MLQQSHAQYQGFRTPGVRLCEALLAELDYHRFESVANTLPGIHAFDKAHTVMLVEQSLLPRQSGRLVLQAARRMEQQGLAEVRAHVGGGDHSFEQYLIQELGEDIGGQVPLAQYRGSG